MSCVGIYNFSFKKGFDLRFSWKDSSGALVNTEGYTAKLTLRNRSNCFSLDLTTSNGKIVLGGATYNVVITATPSDTLGALPAEYDYDLELVSGSGAIVPLLAGTITKEPSAIAP